MNSLNDSAVKLKKTRSGIFMSANRVVYFGPIEKLDLHYYGATVLQVGLFSPFYIRFKNRWFATRCALIPAGFKHEIHYPKGIFGKLFVEIDSAEHECLVRRYIFNPLNISVFYDVEAINCFQKIYHHAFSLKRVNDHIDELINFNGAVKPSAFDVRIQETIKLTEAEIDRNFSTAMLAKEIDLSPSRFQHLFKQEVGISYTQYRLWRRIRAAEVFLNKIDSLTMAANEVGFSDQPHFSRKYKEIFGVSPSMVFNSLVDFEVTIPNDE